MPQKVPSSNDYSAILPNGRCPVVAGQYLRAPKMQFQ